MAQAKPAVNAAPPMKQLSLSKGKESFVFRYADGEERGVLDALADFAKRRDVKFDWFDAAILSHQLGQHLSQELQSLLPKKSA